MRGQPEFLDPIACYISRMAVKIKNRQPEFLEKSN